MNTSTAAEETTGTAGMPIPVDISRKRDVNNKRDATAQQKG
jgi:hypothetical protein